MNQFLPFLPWKPSRTPNIAKSWYVSSSPPSACSRASRSAVDASCRSPPMAKRTKKWSLEPQTSICGANSVIVFLISSRLSAASGGEGIITTTVTGVRVRPREAPLLIEKRFGVSRLQCEELFVVVTRRTLHTQQCEVMHSFVQALLIAIHLPSCEEKDAPSTSVKYMHPP
eukprot:CAMPEP_0178419976 /NCGR_PEP_ID=MMETSP0689_2-20121128/25892_1 /TAXON_ID=160604 /ORGANISM="Amphidinium massartii, Strain CS-259" /LENGTH=170 /DNA_ID=CAMNT_0020041439 /DNA_START=306 /DNA_END=814 /DNA_ORIENTATION=-